MLLDTAARAQNRKNEIAYPIKQAMAGGNIQDFIQNITLFADDATQVGFENAAVITATILVENVTVSG